MTGVVFAMPAMTGITNALPDIPRVYTGICEWLACMVYIAVLYRRASPRRTTIAAMAGLVLLIAVQYFDGMLPIWFWIVGMTLAFGCMYATILFGAGAGKRESLYITARAFVLGELVASLHWQIVTFAGMRDNTLDFDWRSILSLTGTYAICFGLAWLVERGNFSQTAPTLPTTSAAIATVAITVVTFAMSNLSFVSTNTPFSGSVGQEVFYIRTLVDFCGFAILYAQQEQVRRIEANTELASINAQLESQHQEYLQSKENIESLGRLAHDLKHQITALRAQVDPEHAAAGFEQLEKSVQRYSAQQHTGNPVLDVILTTKERTCADRGITFTAVADGSRQCARQCNRSDVETAERRPTSHQTGAICAESIHSGTYRELLRFPTQEGCGRQPAHHEARRPAQARFRREVDPAHCTAVWRRGDDPHRRPLVRVDRAHSTPHRSHGHVTSRASGIPIRNLGGRRADVSTLAAKERRKTS